ncbi:hypothetical protein HQ35_09870 [Porphyromonas cangingivalis]|uniref:DHHW protein n=1 Tax=Porphyromonas cangingivalis TaxID=36874 RepID=A0A0A2EQ76_PORCN|nr:DHHW family protein [Porphyromonas cangingivalis]KGN78514.1 hypothetical protein HQ35_09870 [Porphyromonas cangingivalis]
MKYAKPFLFVVLSVFLALTILFNFFPRSRFSELEKRELATFPIFDFDKLRTGQYTKEVSTWFSDSEPYRDRFMTLSLLFKDKLGLPKSETGVKLHDVTARSMEDLAEVHPEQETAIEDVAPKTDPSLPEPPKDVPQETSEDTNVEDIAKLSNNGIIVFGKGENVRAVMAFGGGRNVGSTYAKVANTYQSTFGDGVRVYCMVIPTAAAFYCPDRAKKYTAPQRPVIDYIHSKLSPEVTVVDVHASLLAHTEEGIYLRTDHHWAPLGAYYAARQLAEVAGVPLPVLETFERKVVKGFVGTMYAFSQDISVKKAPEDFVYHVPLGITYETTYVQYLLDENFKVIGEEAPREGKFFYHYKDGSSGAYSTFMGGDSKITKVKTSTDNTRRLMILKDSFGNALPGYLFGSFEEVHVLDVRYFTRNMIKYVEENAITDILFANNIFNCVNSRLCNRYLTFLKQ